MDLKRALFERRVRSAVRDGDGRRLLDLMASEPTAAGQLVYELGPAAGPALANAVKVAGSDDELRAAIGWAGSSGDTQALDEVRRVLREGPAAARNEALSTLLVHGAPDDERSIVDLLSHPDEHVRDDIYSTLSAFERVGGAGTLPAPIAAAVDAERKRRTATEPAESDGMAEPLDVMSAAGLLVSLCDKIDATYVEPISPDADTHRASLREDIAQVGRAAYEQGGEAMMSEIARLVAFTSPHGGYLDREWTGIGSWMG